MSVFFLTNENTYLELKSITLWRINLHALSGMWKHLGLSLHSKKQKLLITNSKLDAE